MKKQEDQRILNVVNGPVQPADETAGPKKVSSMGWVWNDEKDGATEGEYLDDFSGDETDTGTEVEPGLGQPTTSSSAQLPQIVAGATLLSQAAAA